MRMSSCKSSSQVVVTVAEPIASSDNCEVKPQYVYESHIHPHNVLATLNEQRKKGLLCDMTVIVEGVELPVHKCVLAACSSYFKGIITDPANVSHNIVLELSSISRVGMEHLLEFAYTSKLTLSKDNIDFVLTAARELDIQNLEYSCLNILKQKLLQESCGLNNPTTCVDSKKACKNSTISRKILTSEKSEQIARKKSESSCSMLTKKPTKIAETPVTDCAVSFQNTGDCPLMAQLSLNPKPTALTHPLDVKMCQVTQALGAKAMSQCYVADAKAFSNVDQQQKLVGYLLPQRDHCTIDTYGCRKIQPSCALSSSSSKVHYDLKRETLCPDFKPVHTLPYSPSLTMSACNSDTDEALSADDDIDRNYKCSSANDAAMCSKLRKHPDVVLPFSIEEITQLPRGELQELLNKHPNLSNQQISAMHEIRRRGKNRIAAQRCRKRKMDCIRALQCELEHLHKEHSQLMTERRYVKQNACKLAEVFRKRYRQVFSGICKPTEPSSSKNCSGSKTLPETSKESDGSNEHIMASMAEYFENEATQAGELADRLGKLSSENLPPFSLSCPMLSSSEIVVVCEDDDNDSGSTLKPYSPGVCSSTSYNSEVAESHNENWDKCSLQEMSCEDYGYPRQVKCISGEGAERNFVTCQKAAEICSNNNVMDVDAYKGDCAEICLVTRHEKS
ncbi:transcription regulator protein BACH1-like isoform X2 [Clavelina lepadiformis]|uniref:transcription regulator protein BACH1-like isoform X2 n=1 Tax=Clavelina lepadiformis TaxID=159417 RepID=UPI0040410110